MPKMLKVHVTFGETKRVISHQKGSNVQALRHVFMQVFSDVLSDQVAPAHVTFQQHNDSFADYVELSNDAKIDQDVKVRALVSREHKQGTYPTPSSAESENKSPYSWPHYVIPCNSSLDAFHAILASDGDSPYIPINPGRPIFMKPHRVKPYTNYRLWNIVSKQNDGLIRRNASNNIVTCDGKFSVGSNTVMETSSIARNFVSLIFNDRVAQKRYVVSAGSDKDANIITEEVPPGVPFGDKSTFEPVYFWSYTMFRNKYFSTLYLGCDSTGKTTLVTNTSLEYPNPQTLFVLNKVVLVGDVDLEGM